MSTDPTQRELNAHETHNQAAWDAYSDEYQAKHGAQLAASGGQAWGTSQVSEAELRILGDVAGKDILELGCGAAQWSIALAGAGARPVGLDLSARQLEHARRLMAEAGVDFPLIDGSAEAVPLARRVVRHRLLRPRGDDIRRPVPDRARSRAAAAPRRAVRVQPPFTDRDHPWALGEETVGDRLVIDYFGMHRFDEDDESYFQLPYGEWIRLFRENGFIVEDLIEPRPPEGATSSYRNAGRDGVGETLAIGGASGGCVGRERAGPSLTSRTRRSPGPCSRSSARRTPSRPS